MAQLKSGSTVDGTEIAKKDGTNFASSLPTALVNQLKGDTGTNGTNGTNGTSGTVSVSGTTLTIG